MVAPSFQTYKLIVAEPFLKNGKLYVTVEHPNTHNHRDVRWYNDQEYRKAYPKLAATAPASGFTGLKKARGFANGPIVVLRGNNDEWYSASVARYATDVGWYIASTDPVPAFPSQIKGIYLSWDEIKDGDDCHINSPSVIKSIITEKFKRNRDLVERKEV